MKIFTQKITQKRKKKYPFSRQNDSFIFISKSEIVNDFEALISKIYFVFKCYIFNE